MKIVLAQINSTVGAFERNFQKMGEVLRQNQAADLVVFPECALCGYPAQDLLDYLDFLKQSEVYEQKLIESFPKQNFIFGNISRNSGPGRPLHNAAVFVESGKIKARYAKRLLPTYDVFDEDRFFEPGRKACLVEFKGKTLALSVCEDIWNNEIQSDLHNRYEQYPLEDCRAADLLINISASPFEASKVEAKRKMLDAIAKAFKKPFVYVNAVGANDSLIFDGRSYAWNQDGSFVLEGGAFAEQTYELELFDDSASSFVTPTKPNAIKDIYDALVLGIRDYAQKVGFKSAILGLSGGIDSSVVACLAADAMGPTNVTGLMMPSRFTSKDSNEDALYIAKKMQNPLHIYIIEEMYTAALRTLSMAFKEVKEDVTEENLQSRIRGMIVMAMSNKFGHLVLTTGNKSELAIGYCTLYGDMCGGLAPLADVYKMQVYELGHEANRRQERIPERVFSKPPTAELRENQKDQDTLPPYERLDEILKDVIENFLTREALIKKGHSKEEVEKTLKLLAANEYKRYQMPLGLKVSSKAFGIGRRVPLVHRFFN
ncbi:MAG: NAD+ synthase [Deltaproteobacteria bacterium CG11_big_fil_rev_8_21_14_0_20_45_16]|nr:MAG: NAD+ synthase [Deltaproteobacteria bacterium CG11_big_fil_rev_8_21_14_0_20_45_16]